MSWPEEKPREDGLTSLAAGESLLPGQYIVSPNDNARFTLEENGNATIFKLRGKPNVLNSNKKVVGAALVNGEDGNLVLTNEEGEPAGWATESEGEGAYLTVTDDGVLQYTAADGTLLWDSKDGKKKAGDKGAPAPGSAEEAALTKQAPPPLEEPAKKEGEVMEGNGQVMMQSITPSDTKNAPVEFVAEIKETWERDGAHHVQDRDLHHQQGRPQHHRDAGGGAAQGGGVRDVGLPRRGRGQWRAPAGAAV